ncbi:MAG: hypothetical protein GEV05_06400 [Betaproteobacteria bacterium]|nr:hypothetical protein [Betaproteobacteria bacterium]
MKLAAGYRNASTTKSAAEFRSLTRTLCVVSVLAHGGCAHVGYDDAIESLSHFRPLAQSSQVRYAPGAEAFARQVAALLPAATAHVETMHYRPFRDEPVVYVCGNDACFHRFVDPRWNFTAAVVYDNRLLLAPRLFDREPQRLVPILLHELSHLHMGQVRGHYSLGIPVWFHEGLASFVAHGGGADLASDEQAWAAAASQHYFLPDEQHLPWQSRRMADDWKLPVSVFYRQALLFVRWLHRRDPQAFRRLLISLQNGADFDAAFAQAYQANPARAAAAFFDRGPPEPKTIHAVKGEQP